MPEFIQKAGSWLIIVTVGGTFLVGAATMAARDRWSEAAVVAVLGIAFAALLHWLTRERHADTSIPGIAQREREAAALPIDAAMERVVKLIEENRLTAHGAPAGSVADLTGMPPHMRSLLTRYGDLILIGRHAFVGTTWLRLEKDGTFRIGKTRWGTRVLFVPGEETVYEVDGNRRESYPSLAHWLLVAESAVPPEDASDKHQESTDDETIG